MFPRLYADVVISSDPNSFEAKILAKHYEKIVAYTERTKLMSNLKSCTHIKVTGVRCGSPPLRGRGRPRHMRLDIKSKPGRRACPERSLRECLSHTMAYQD